MYTPPLTTLGVIYYIVVAIAIISLLVFFFGIVVPAFLDLRKEDEV